MNLFYHSWDIVWGAFFYGVGLTPFIVVGAVFAKWLGLFGNSDRLVFRLVQAERENGELRERVKYWREDACRRLDQLEFEAQLRKTLVGCGDERDDG